MTLLELLAVLAIIAALAAVALPSMGGLLARNRADAALEQMLGTVRFVRHLAISQGQTAMLCLGDGATCGRSGAWHGGGTVFLDANRNRRADSGDTVAFRLPALDGGFRVKYSRSLLRITPRGLTGDTGTFTICPPDGSADLGRLLRVNNQGRVEIDRQSTAAC
jgi:type IV fimbrial biogenesis protein FimT